MPMHFSFLIRLVNGLGNGIRSDDRTKPVQAGGTGFGLGDHGCLDKRDHDIPHMDIQRGEFNIQGLGQPPDPVFGCGVDSQFRGAVDG